MKIQDITGISEMQAMINGAQLRGSELCIANGTAVGGIPQVKAKLNQLFREQVVQNPNVQQGRQAAFELTALLFQLDQLPQEKSLLASIATRVLGSPFEHIKADCRAHIKKDPALLQRVAEKYNILAREWNGQINFYHADPAIGESLQLKQLLYLNSFLGLTWSQRQLTGHAPVPLEGELDDLAAEASPQIYKPAQCETLHELVGLVSRTATSQLVNEHGGRFTAEMAEVVEERALTLLRHEAKHAGRISGTLALQALQVLYEVDWRRPDGSRRARAVANTWEECRIALSRDTPLYLKISAQYNSWVEYSNLGFINACGAEPRQERYWEAARIGFFGELLGLKPERCSLQPDHGGYVYRTQLYPESYVAMTHAELTVLEQRITFCSMLLNTQMELVRQRTRLATLERQLDHGDLASLLLTEEQRSALDHERRALNVALCGMPPTMPEPFFRQLWTEQLNRMEVLGIKPTSEQRRMRDKLPLLGLDIPSPAKLVFDFNELSLPNFINFYNVRVRIVNTVREQLLLEQKVESCLQKVRYDSMMSLLGSSAMDDYTAAKAELAEFKEKTDTTERHWGFVSALEFRSKVLQLAEFLGFVKLTREQILGEERWPEIDIATVPRPSDSKLIPELEKLTPQQRASALESWPEHWKNDLSPQLQRLFAAELPG